MNDMYDLFHFTLNFDIYTSAINPLLNYPDFSVQKELEKIVILINPLIKLFNQINKNNLNNQDELKLKEKDIFTKIESLENLLKNHNNLPNLISTKNNICNKTEKKVKEDILEKINENFNYSLFLEKKFKRLIMCHIIKNKSSSRILDGIITDIFFKFSTQNSKKFSINNQGNLNKNNYNQRNNLDKNKEKKFAKNLITGEISFIKFCIYIGELDVDVEWKKEYNKDIQSIKFDEKNNSFVFKFKQQSANVKIFKMFDSVIILTHLISIS